MSIDQRYLNWISTEGGPLILMPERCLNYWGGVEAPTDGRIIQANFRWDSIPNAPATDYDRACDIGDYLGMLTIKKGWGIVFNDMPYETAWYPLQNVPGGIIVRLSRADEEEHAITSIGKIADDIWKKNIFYIEVDTDPLYLFDAAYPGIYLLQTSDFLRISLQVGKYGISTGIHTPDEYTELLLHKILMI